MVKEANATRISRGMSAFDPARWLVLWPYLFNPSSFI
jgi:hypothetical protein